MFISFHLRILFAAAMLEQLSRELTDGHALVELYDLIFHNIFRISPFGSSLGDRGGSASSDNAAALKELCRAKKMFLTLQLISR